jgi:hypothetical protein
MANICRKLLFTACRHAAAMEQFRQPADRLAAAIVAYALDRTPSKY